MGAWLFLKSKFQAGENSRIKPEIQSGFWELKFDAKTQRRKISKV
jgi:hypothetical protein